MSEIIYVALASSHIHHFVSHHNPATFPALYHPKECCVTPPRASATLTRSNTERLESHCGIRLCVDRNSACSVYIRDGTRCADKEHFGGRDRGGAGNGHAHQRGPCWVSGTFAFTHQHPHTSSRDHSPPPTHSRHDPSYYRNAR